MAQQDVTGVITLLGTCLQRFSASLGLGNNPTSVDLSLVPDNVNDPNAVVGGTGYDYTNGTPGKILSLNIGAFKFIGFINSWERQDSVNGWNYSVRATDPRAFFNNIPIILDSNSPANLAVNNCLNPFNYYGGAVSADRTKDGMSFRKIRDFLTSGSGNLNLFGYQFKLRFSSGYFDASGTLNPTGVPEWYRIPDNQTNLGSLIDNVSRDLGLDYFAHIDYASFNPTGVSIIDVKEINRTYFVSGTSISGIVTNAVASGIATQFSIGQELRTDHIGSVVFGDKYTYWYTPATSQILPYWGRSNNGSAIYPLDGDVTTGMVLLDNIIGSGSERITNTITIPNISITQTPNSSVYPPTTSRVYTNDTVSGYRPTTNVMRASLISQPAWEAALFKDHQTFAEQIGIPVQRFMLYNGFINAPETIRSASNLIVRHSGIFNRPAYVANLISAIYEATRNTVSTYWGKQFICDLPTAPMFVSGQYDHSELYPTIDYSIASSANAESVAYPSGITNHELLIVAHNPSFKDDVGRLRPFVSIREYSRNTNTLGMPIDTSILDKNSAFYEQGEKLVLPISVQQYEKFPTKAIFTINQEIKGNVQVSGLNNAENLGEAIAFLNYFGYGNTAISDNLLLQNFGTNFEYRLAAPRLTSITSVQGNYGVHIPLQKNFEYFGPFIATGTSSAGLNVIIDQSLAPWTYGGVAKMMQAGQLLANRSVANIAVIDKGSFTLAGFPTYNLGDQLGNNANINNISLQYGTDGLTTSYNLSTFALPSVRMSKLLSEQISRYYYLSNQTQREIINLNKLIPLNPPAPINRPDAVNAAAAYSKSRQFTENNEFYVGKFKQG